MVVIILSKAHLVRLWTFCAAIQHELLSLYLWLIFWSSLFTLLTVTVTPVYNLITYLQKVEELVIALVNWQMPLKWKVVMTSCHRLVNVFICVAVDTRHFLYIKVLVLFYLFSSLSAYWTEHKSQFSLAVGYCEHWDLENPIWTEPKSVKGKSI